MNYEDNSRVSQKLNLDLRNKLQMCTALVLLWTIEIFRLAFLLLLCVEKNILSENAPIIKFTMNNFIQMGTIYFNK